jgi:SAM-dependent methyltransferase
MPKILDRVLNIFDSNINLGDENHSEAMMCPVNRWDRVGLPNTLKGLSFCDIGCWEGGFCVEAVKRRATHVLGVDMCTCQSLRKNIEKHKFNFAQLDIQSEKFLELPNFDVVSCCGVLYHVENPMSLVFRLRKMTRKLLVLETLALSGEDKVPLMRFHGRKAGTPSRWWAPNEACLTDMLDAAGFGNIHRVFKIGGNGNYCRLCVKAEPRTNPSYEKISPRRKEKMELVGGERKHNA